MTNAGKAGGFGTFLIGLFAAFTGMFARVGGFHQQLPVSDGAMMAGGAAVAGLGLAAMLSE